MILGSDVRRRILESPRFEICNYNIGSVILIMVYNDSYILYIYMDQDDDIVIYTIYSRSQSHTATLDNDEIQQLFKELATVVNDKSYLSLRKFIAVGRVMIILILVFHFIDTLHDDTNYSNIKI